MFHSWIMMTINRTVPVGTTLFKVHIDYSYIEYTLSISDNTIIIIF